MSAGVSGNRDANRLTGKVLILLAGALILFIRRSDAFLSPTFWAEDGPEFYGAARETGLASLLRAYNGYHHLLPRLVALLARLVPPTAAPTFMAVGATLLHLAILALVLDRRAGMSRPALAFLLALAVPHRGEVFANVANLANVLPIALVVVLLGDPAESRRRALQDLAVLLLAGASTVTTVFLAPLFLVRALWRRDPQAFTQAGLMIALALWQGLGMESQRSPGAFDGSHEAWPYALAVRWIGTLLVPRAWLRDLLTPVWPALAAALIFWAGWTIWAVRRRDGRSLLLLAASAAIQGAVIVAYRSNPWYLAVSWGDRYSYPALVLLVWFLLRAASQGGAARILAAILLAASLAASFSSFRSEPTPHPSWRPGAAGIGGKVPLVLPTSPKGWSVSYDPRREGRPADFDRPAELQATLGPSVIDSFPAGEGAATWLDGRPAWMLPAGVALVLKPPAGARRFTLTVASWGASSLSLVAYRVLEGQAPEDLASLSQPEDPAFRGHPWTIALDPADARLIALCSAPGSIGRWAACDAVFD